ncbi:MAG: DUF5683 domain-containing protein [Balneolales bacterium]|nr:DUF5683 domain-containing protein [Balneolales bacterium]
MNLILAVQTVLLMLPGIGVATQDVATEKISFETQSEQLTFRMYHNESVSYSLKSPSEEIMVNFEDLLVSRSWQNDVSLRQNGNGAFDPDHLVQVYQLEGQHSSSFLNAISTQPGYGLLASLAVPGLGQYANQQYWKTGVMLAVEATAIYFIVDGSKRGRRLEAEYKQIGDDNWSVLKYTKWIHNYYMGGARSPGAPDVTPEQLLTAAGRSNVNPTTGWPDVVYDTSREWNWVNRTELNIMERNTLYLNTGSNFPHDVHPFGDQQYYELMSKYPQYGPGWRDWDDSIHDINQTDLNTFLSPMFLDHAHLESRFNGAYQLANNMVSLLILNHVVSAFDSYFTIKLRQHRLETTAHADFMGTHVNFTWKF